LLRLEHGLFFSTLGSILWARTTIFSSEGRRLRMKKRVTLLFTSVFVLWVSMPVVAQSGSSQGEAKEAPAQVNAEKAVSGRWSGVVMGRSKSASTLTVRRKDGVMRTIHYDGSTQ